MIGRAWKALGSAGLLVTGTVWAAFATLSAAAQSAGSPPSSRADRTAILLAINDVYRIEGLEDGAVGGLPRVRALRKELEMKVAEQSVRGWPGERQLAADRRFRVPS